MATQEEEFKENFAQNTRKHAQRLEQEGAVGYADTLSRAPKELENAQAPADYSIGTEGGFDPEAKAKELNDIGLSDESVYDKAQDPDTLLSDVQEGVRYQKYRNTGVDYFDKKDRLSLLDAYMAKQLGLNVSYNFHKIDMKVDNTQRNQNFTGYNKNMNEAEQGLLALIGHISSMSASEHGGVSKDAVQRMAAGKFGGYFNTGSDRQAATEMFKANAMGMKNMGVGGSKKPTDSDKQDMNKLIGEYTTNTARMIAVSPALMTNALAQFEVNYRSAAPMMTPAQRAQKENTLRTFKEVQKLLSSTDINNKAAMQENTLKMMAAMNGLEKGSF